MDDNKLQMMVKAIETEYNNGLQYLKQMRIELGFISGFRQTKAIRTKRRFLVNELNELQEKLRDKFEQLQSVKNKLEAPAE